MLSLATTLKYYKRPDVCRALVSQARTKEVAVRYGGGFGKRPDMLVYDRDVLSFAQRKATSFHVSEESWSNPMQLRPGMRSSECNDVRIGWDFVLDIDFPVFEGAKLIAQSCLDFLLSSGIPREAVSVKFSGNKGFHLVLPFEAFPESYVDESDVEVFTSDLFPDGAKQLITYVCESLDGLHNEFALSKKLLAIDGVESDVSRNAKTGMRLSGEESLGHLFVCPVCEYSARSSDDFVSCPRDGTFMKKIEQQESVDVLSTVDLGLDAQLMSSRHMYRMAYSLHEKSGLVSIPVSDIMSFSFDDALPEKIDNCISFPNRSVPSNCAQQFLYAGMRYTPVFQEKVTYDTNQTIEWEGQKAPEEVFPPPIKALLGQLRDGRKRALFVLVNFLRSVGWSLEEVEERMITWNNSQPDPMRENEIISHLRYQSKKPVALPPNFDNDMYYKDVLGDAFVHDEYSRSVKNPVSYVRKRIKVYNHKTK